MGLSGSEGKTNAINPGVTNELEKSFKELVRLGQIPVPSLPAQPTKNLPRARAGATRMGKLIGICPYELDAIMAHEFTEEDTLALVALKKFLTAAKLSGSIDLSPIRKQLKTIEDSHSKEMGRWETSRKNVLKQRAQIIQGVEEATNKFKTTWRGMLIDLIKNLDAAGHVDKLGRMDYWIVQALATHKGIVTNAKGNARINFKAAAELEVNKVQDLSKIAREMERTKFENDLRQKACVASVKQLAIWWDDTSLDNISRLIVEEEISNRYRTEVCKASMQGELEYDYTDDYGLPAMGRAFGGRNEAVDVHNMVYRLLIIEAGER